MKAEPHMKVEDEEDLLYGESGSALKLNSVCNFLENYTTKTKCESKLQNVCIFRWQK